MNVKDFAVRTLGTCRVDSPFAPLLAARQRSINNVDETDRVLFDDIASEAISSPNGVGLVKVMGRHSGFIACYAALAKSDANFVLIPEVPFELNGPTGLLAALQERLKCRGHAVIVVAEGVGQALLEACPKSTDVSGNARLGDIGLFLKQKICAHFSSPGIELNLKYIDPSYLIRSVPANPFDSVIACV